MIRYGCRAGGSAGCSGIRQSVTSPASATRATTLASSHAAADATATHSTPRTAKTTITATGARTKTASDSHRTRPRRDKNKNAATRLTTTAAPPTASIATLLNPANSSRITIATATSTKLRRASQRCERVPSGLDTGVTAAAGAHVEAT